MSCLDPGDQVIVPEPFYANYNGFAQMAGVQIVPVTARIEDGFALPPISDFAAKINDKTKAILLCNPGNPTGTVYAPESLDALAQLVRDHDLYLFADEVYREFCYDGAQPKSVLQLPGLEQHVVLVDSVSKRYSMCGARIGAMVTKNVAVRKAAMKFAMARLSPHAGPNRVRSRPENLRVVLRAGARPLRGPTGRPVKGLRNIQGVTVPNPGGAFYAVCELPNDNADAFCQLMLEHLDLDGDTVMMAPATGFYATPGAGTRQVRIAYVLDLPLIERAVECLRAALGAYPGYRDA